MPKELAAFWQSSYPNWEFSHENDIAKGCTHDRHWIPKLAETDPDRDWLILTRDKGRNDKRANDKLPKVCKHHGCAYLIISETLGKMESCKAALASVWTSLPMVIVACRKLRHTVTHVKLSKHMAKNQAVSYRIRVQGRTLEEYLKS